MRKLLQFSSLFILLFCAEFSRAQVTPTCSTTVLSSNWSYTAGWQANCIAPPVDQILSNCQIQSSTTPVNTLPASCSFTLQPYRSGTNFVYTFPTVQNLSNANVNIGLKANFAGKYAWVFVSDNANKSTLMTLGSIFPIPNSSTPYIYSIDFNTVKGDVNLASITKISVILYDSPNGGPSTLSLYGNITISDIQVVAGATGTITNTSAQFKDAWAVGAEGIIFNQNNAGIVMGSKPSLLPASLIAPYYTLNIKGRTNFIGNDNVIGIWSNTLQANGKRHYMGISNDRFADNVTEYSLINSGEYGSGYTGKSLILQNNNGNVGIGSYTSVPPAKLSVNGKVLIGVNQPTAYLSEYKLAVEGTLVSQKSVISAPNYWADFVFKKNYQLPTIEQQQEFIEKNGHLMNIPSEQEVMTNGYDLSNMDAQLLQKMEELYLYTIQLDQLVKKQQTEIELLKKQLENSNR